MAVVGGNEEAAALAVKLESYPPWFHQVVGFYADFPVAEAGDNLITMEAKWERWLLEHPAETYVICPGIPPEIKMRIAVSAIARGTAVYLVPELYEIFLLGAKIAHVDDVPVLELPELGFSPAATAWKRITDVIFAGIGLVVAAPCMAIIALLVWMTSPGPVLFRQERVGMNGRPFVLYKFRTMRDGAETVSGPVLAKRADPRVTPLGRWLRCSHLDELPQLYNVLHGDMSLVGPRPERPHFFREFAVQVPGYVQRLIVKGGITGLAQVEGKYETSPVDKVRYDLLYAKSFSVFMEVRIMLRTLSALFRKGRAL